MTPGLSRRRAGVSARVGGSVVWAVLCRPWLWPTAVRQALDLAAPGWWRGWPHLPLPDPAYLGFRLETMYGDARHAPAPADVVAYLHWCRMQRRGLR